MVKSSVDGLNYLEIKPMTRPLDSIQLRAPTSKSITHRAFIIAALASGKSKIRFPLIAEDTLLTLHALRMMGSEISMSTNLVAIKGSNGKLHAPSIPIMLDNSGTSFRFLTSVAAVAEGETILQGNERMCQRPIEGLITALKMLGVESEYLGREGFPPVKISSSLIGGEAFLDGNTSSQFFSSILQCAPYAQRDVTLFSTSRIKSKPYIDVTASLMEDCGVHVNSIREEFRVGSNQKYHSFNLVVEGDWSNTAYFFSAVAVLGGSLQVSGLNMDSCQGDKFFLQCMEQMGCKISVTDDYVELRRNLNDSLTGIDVDLGNHPDIVQTLAIVACFAETPSSLRNISTLKFKETDRVCSTTRELRKIGVDVEVSPDTIKVYPIRKPLPAVIETDNDHRMAMSFSIAGLKIPGIIIRNPSCVKKSFPRFYDFLRVLQQGDMI